MDNVHAPEAIAQLSRSRSIVPGPETSMTDPDFPQALRAFIQDTIPNVEAAEVLLLLARDRRATLQLERIVEGLRSTALDPGAVKRYLARFQERSLVVQLKDGAYQFDPASPALDEVVRALAKAYNERPVTLVRLIYSLKDEKIRSFSDAFRLKKD
jgi:hypothetical protein